MQDLMNIQFYDHLKWTTLNSCHGNSQKQRDKQEFAERISQEQK